ncbi:cupin domain-containing protein [Litchfieldella rifensis]|uniref:Cupin domain-containing protein n=1 Tax=Litchfieldella rifensis TaxID=762643 RepID=A0ABV7LJT0_9GAMM
MKNLFASIPKDLEQEFFETVVQGEGIKVERIVSRGHRSPASGWYDQAQSEWVVVLKGEAIIAFEQEGDVVLEPGDHIDIPAHKRHRVKWTDPEQETVWLAVHYSRRKA